MFVKAEARTVVSWSAEKSKSEIRFKSLPPKTVPRLLWILFDIEFRSGIQGGSENRDDRQTSD